MLEFVYLAISMSLVFLLGSVFGERDAIYGYVLIPLFGGVMWLLGFLPNVYVASVIPLLLGLAVVTFIREQFRQKFAGGGSASSLIWKIMAFIVFLQFAIVFVSGIITFQGAPTILAPQNTELKGYNLENATRVYGNYTSINSIDQVTVGLTLVWTAWNLTWAMIFGIFLIYPNLVNVFQLAPEISLVISAGFYIMLALEVFVLLMFRTRPPEI